MDEWLEDGVRIFPMAWHVDYWNYPGYWVDPYSHEDWTSRQQQYVQSFGLDYIYTPQMVVNGVVEFSGGSEFTLASEIDAALQTDVSTSVTGWLEAYPEGDSIEVHFEVLDGPGSSWVNIVLVERDLVSEITGGENAGETLEHDNVVRAFVQANPSNGVAELVPIDDVVWENTSVILFVQAPWTMEMAGATGFHVGPPPE